MVKALTFLIVLTGTLAAPTQAHAFAEDICVRSVRSGLKNCMDSNCDENGDRARCRANVLIDGGVTTLIREGRSLYHTDATYFLAQAAGFSPEAAYWIAAYDQAADSVTYKPFDRCGDPLDNQDALSTLPLRGFNRNAVMAGGTGFHLPVPYRPKGFEGPLPVNGLSPNLGDALHEGMLVHVRRWAEGSQVLCVNGLTKGGETLFDGAACYSVDMASEAPGDGKNDEQPPGSIRYGISTISAVKADVPFTAKLGRQMAEFEANILNPSDRGDVVMAKGLDAYLARGQGRLGEDPVPSELVRLGVYLHMLQDRISHHECGDGSVMIGPDDQGRFEVKYEDEACSQDYHALYHFQETSHDTLPPRSESAIRLSLQELRSFAGLWAGANPSWMGEGESIDDEDLIQAILKALKAEKAEERVDAFTAIAKAFNLSPLPGHGEDKRCGLF